MKDSPAFQPVASPSTTVTSFVVVVAAAVVVVEVGGVGARVATGLEGKTNS